MLSALIMGALFTTSCSSDDDGGGEKLGCLTCTDAQTSREYCNLGDGVFTIQTEGFDPVENTLPDGVSFQAFIDGLEAGSDLTCD